MRLTPLSDFERSPRPSYLSRYVILRNQHCECRVITHGNSACSIVHYLAAWPPTFNARSVSLSDFRTVGLMMGHLWFCIHPVVVHVPSLPTKRGCSAPRLCPLSLVRVQVPSHS